MTLDKSIDIKALQPDTIKLILCSSNFLNLNEQLAVENVFVLYTTICGHGDTTVDVYFEQGGEGYYISEGRMCHVTWTKPSPNEKIRIFNDAGEEVEVNRGVSYVCIVDTDYFGMSSYSETSGGEMYALGIDREQA